MKKIILFPIIALLFISIAQAMIYDDFNRADNSNISQGFSTENITWGEYDSGGTSINIVNKSLRIDCKSSDSYFFLDVRNTENNYSEGQVEILFRGKLLKVGNGGNTGIASGKAPMLGLRNNSKNYGVNDGAVQAYTAMLGFTVQPYGDIYYYANNPDNGITLLTEKTEMYDGDDFFTWYWFNYSVDYDTGTVIYSIYNNTAQFTKGALIDSIDNKTDSNTYPYYLGAGVTYGCNYGTFMFANISMEKKGIIEQPSIIWLNETPLNGSFMTTPEQTLYFYSNATETADTCTLFKGNESGGTVITYEYNVLSGEKRNFTFNITESEPKTIEGYTLFFIGCQYPTLSNTFSLNRSHKIDLNEPQITINKPYNFLINYTSLLEWNADYQNTNLESAYLNISNDIGETIYENYTTGLNSTIYTIIGNENVSDIGYNSTFYTFYFRVSDNLYNSSNNVTVNICYYDFICSHYSCKINNTQYCDEATETQICGYEYIGDYSEFPPINCTYTENIKLDLIHYDLTETTNIMILFVISFLYIGCMGIAFLFKNRGFLSLAYVISLVIGLMLSGIHIAITIGFLILNSLILMKSGKDMK